MPANAPHRDAVLRQLERILAHPLFRNSKRYPTLLRYVVEHHLAGGGPIKERTLGVDVLGREPDYDTNADPVVRTSAGEIRKRLAQYYQEPGHETELRIELPVGAYTPEFHNVGESEPAATPTPAARAYPRWLWPLALLPTLVVLLLWQHPWSHSSALHQFWQPLNSASAPALLCVGQRERLDVGPPQPPDYDPSKRAVPPKVPENAVSLYQLYLLGPQNVAMPDVSTLARVAGLLQSEGKAYRIRGELATSFEDLRESPAVLIGGFNNDWTMRLTGELRYGFVRKGSLYVLRDREYPERTAWSVDYTTPYLQVKKDYALVSRVVDANTGHVAVVIAGLTGAGTISVGELLTSEELFHAVAEMAPSGWASKNLQIVVETEVIRGNSGPPKVLAVHAF